jgi:hypothetical protein
LEVEFPIGVEWERREEGGLLSGPPEGWTLTVRAGHDLPALHPLGEERLLSGAARDWFATLDNSPGSDLIRMARRNLSFQVFQEKVVAGSWQYLTYFGRDTLLTSLLLGDTASVDFHEVVLRGVLERLDPEGRVAHEEDIGEQTAYLQPPRTGPVYDYKMVDDDFLLLPCLAALANHPDVPESWLRTFVGTQRDPLERNLRWCLNRLGDLIPINHPWVGD